MASNVLSASVASNLLALNNTVVGIETTSKRLTTGYKVNSPADNPGAYFTSQNLLAQKDTYAGLVDGIGQGAQTVQTAIDGMNAIRDLLSEMQSVALQASGLAGAANDASRGSLGATYDTLYAQINQLANDTVYNGTALINNSGVDLSVRFGTSAASTFVVTGINVLATGFNIPAGAAAVWGAGGGDADAVTAVNSVATAITTLLAYIASYSAQLGLIEARSSFTQTLSNDLQAGSDALVKADLNEEGARLLALQTLQSLGVNAINVEVGNTSAIVGLSTGFRGN